jgi:hypothetical protein
VVQGLDAGNGEFDLIGGYLNANLGSGLGTVHETLVANPNAPDFTKLAVFENSNGDEPTYDDRVFVPANSPTSPDGAQVTYAGGIRFQTAAPSNNDVYISAYNQGSFGGCYYFAGWDHQGLLGDGSTGTFTVTNAGLATPEPSTIASAAVGGVCALIFTLFRRNKASGNGA